MYVLGLNAYHADASAALLHDGEVVAAAEEERFTRVKHAAGFPVNAVRYCLAEAGIRLSHLDHVAVSSRPMSHAQDEVLFILSGRASYGEKVKARLRRTARDRDILALLAKAFAADPRELQLEVHQVEHQIAHMASAFFASPFETAALLSVDGFGDFCSTMLGHGRERQIKVVDKVLYPDSLGIFYTLGTQFLGFRGYGDEGKLMALAAHGTDRLVEAVRELLLEPQKKKLFQLNLDYFRHQRDGVTMSWEQPVPTMERIWSEKMEEVFGPPRRGAHTKLYARHKDLAYAFQAVLEEKLIAILRSLHERTGEKAVAIAGGVAMNCVANGRIAAETPFERVFVQPAATDAGTALGAAYFVSHCVLGRARREQLQDPYLGPAYTEAQARRAIERAGLAYRKVEDPCGIAASLLERGRILGWFQGRMEFGPRALGNRSILADPRDERTRERLNERVKYREQFRPFAPSILAESLGEYFEGGHASPFMLFAFRFREGARRKVPAVVHADGTGRVHTVTKAQNPRFHALIEAFRERTSVPLVLNTSFNENEPIVCSPEDAVKCFQETRMDALVLGDLVVERV